MQQIAGFETPNVRSEPDTYPLEVAKAFQPKDIGFSSVGDDAFELGDVVRISADDYGPELITGTIVKLAPNHIGIKQVTDELGEIAIHFPRLGFQIDVA